MTLLLEHINNNTLKILEESKIKFEQDPTYTKSKFGVSVNMNQIRFYGNIDSRLGLLFVDMSANEAKVLYPHAIKTIQWLSDSLNSVTGDAYKMYLKYVKDNNLKIELTSSEFRTSATLSQIQVSSTGSMNVGYNLSNNKIRDTSFYFDLSKSNKISNLEIIII